MRLKELWVQLKQQWPHLSHDPVFLAAAGAVVGLLIAWLLIRTFRARRIRQDSSGEYLHGEDFKQKRKVGKSIQKTLEELRHDDPQFVELMRAILKYRTIDQLLSHDEIEVAFGRLSYLQEKKKTPPKKHSSLLTLTDDSQDEKEKHAAMLTVVRSCCASDEIYSTLDEPGRQLVDQFLDSVTSESGR
jgi:hypothetical protein